MWGLEDEEGSYSFRTDEFNMFLRGLKYGYGGLGASVGERNGISGSSNGGFFLYNNEDFFSPVVTYEVGNTYLNWKWAGDELNYYALMPGAGVGASIKFKGLEAYAIYKRGMSFTNINDKRFLHPDLYNYEGYQYFLQYKELAAISVSKMTFNYREFKSYVGFTNITNYVKIGYKREEYNFAPNRNYFLIKLAY